MKQNKMTTYNTCISILFLMISSCQEFPYYTYPYKKSNGSLFDPLMRAVDQKQPDKFD